MRVIQHTVGYARRFPRVEDLIFLDPIPLVYTCMWGNDIYGEGKLGKAESHVYAMIPVRWSPVDLLRRRSLLHIMEPLYYERGERTIEPEEVKELLQVEDLANALEFA